MNGVVVGGTVVVGGVGVTVVGVPVTGGGVGTNWTEIDPVTGLQQLPPPDCVPE
jgi:hypothetical protein